MGFYRKLQEVPGEKLGTRFRSLYNKDHSICLETQVAEKSRPLCPKVAHSPLKVWAAGFRGGCLLWGPVFWETSTSFILGHAVLHLGQWPDFVRKGGLLVSIAVLR